MSRKVFISILGTSFYSECKYRRDGFTSKSTRFIQRATLEWLGAGEWGEEDRVFIATTKGARKWNWNESTTMRSPKPGDPEVPYTPLETTLKEMKLKAKVEAVDIPDGGNEEEMWRIFSILFGLIEEGDELYFDLTHSFRYLPMLVLVLGNYSKFLKGVSVRSITYGNYEARDKDCIAPIIDLLPLTALQDWTFAIADYLQNGNVGRLNKEAMEAIRPLQKQIYMSGGDNGLLQEIKDLRSAISDLTTVVQEWETCRGMDVIGSRCLARLKIHLEHVNKSKNEIMPMLTPLLKKLEESLVPFNADADVANMFAAAEWCYKNQQYQAAVTFLEEGVISFFCQRHGIRLDDEQRRGLVNSALYFLREPEEYDPMKYSEEDRETIGHLMADELLGNRRFQNLYDDVCRLRNDYNHCGMRSQNQPMLPSTIMDNIGRSIAGVREILFG